MGVVVCVAVEGRFLRADNVAELGHEAVQAEASGAGVVFVSEGALGDPVVLVAGLGPLTTSVLLGVRTTLAPGGRHPAVLARDLTSLDLVCGGRTVLCFAPPFGEPDRLAEAMDLCRVLWRDGEAAGGAYFPVAGAVNRPRPAGPASPRLALDLTGSEELVPALAASADLVVRPTGVAGVCEVVPA